MRVTDAKIMGRMADQSTSSTKRALLLAVIVASTSNVNAHSPAGKSIDSQSVSPAPSAILVDQNTELMVQQGIGTARNNPIVSLPRHAPHLVARPTKLPLTSERNRPLAALEGERSNDQDASRFAVPVDVAPIGVLGDKDSSVMPVADARDERQTITETQPIFFTLSDGSPISEHEQPAADAVSLGKTQSVAAETGHLESPDRKTPNTETEKDTPKDTVGVIAESNGGRADAKTKASLTSVNFPVKLAPMIDLSSPPAVPSTRSVTESVTASVDTPLARNVAKPDSDQLAASAANRVSPATQSPNAPPPAVLINLNDSGPLDENADSSSANAIEVTLNGDASVGDIDSGFAQDSETFTLTDSNENHDLNNDLKNDPDHSTIPKLLSPTRKRTAIAVASLPMPIQRVDVDGNVAKPTIDTVTHDPSRAAEVITSEKVTMTLADRSDRNKNDSLVTPRVAKSVLGKSAVIARSTPLEQLPRLPPSEKPRPETPASEHRSKLKGESVPAKLVTSKQNLQSAKKQTPGQRREPVVLHLSHAQVRSMTIGGDLRAVIVDDKNICQAFEAGASQIKLIGTGLGKTTLTIWADVKPGEPTRTQSFEIEVSDGVNATGDKVSERTALLNESIDKAFPRASVVVSRRGGELNVTGRCDTEAEAKQIIRIVRKSCLVPVQDNLKVRQL